jgi:hypothetical protein
MTSNKSKLTARKPKCPLILRATTMALALRVLGDCAYAADLYWDTNGSASGLGGATGNWNTTAGNTV